MNLPAAPGSRVGAPRPRRAERVAATAPHGPHDRGSVATASYSGSSSARRPAGPGVPGGGGYSSSSSAPSSSYSSSGPQADAAADARQQAASREQLQRRAAQLSELVQETGRVAVTTGPRGFFRALQAADSVGSLVREYLVRGTVDPTPVFLRKLFEKLGATYIKLGQFIASSPSLFPDEYVLEFQKCLDKAEPVPFATIQRIVEQELGQPWSSVFVSIDPVPLATASVAQVHAAVLKNSNKQVVLKVLKPGVEDVLSSDLSFVYIMSRWLEFIQPEVGVVGGGGGGTTR